MVKINLLCRQCYAQFGYSQRVEQMPDGTFVCPKNPQHRYKKEEDGTLTTIAFA